MSDQDPRIRDFLHVFAHEPGKRLWYGGASLLGSLRGVNARQAAWVAPDHDHSIWQLLLHCAYSRYNVRRLFEGSSGRGGFPRTGGYWAALPPKQDASTWKEDINLFKDEHQKLVAAVKGFDARRLDDLATKEFRFIDLLWGIVMHDMVHVGELQVLKRLYQLHATQP
jgi:hypothetical protein